MAVLVNSSVFDRCYSKSILPWTIFDLGDATVSLGHFYHQDCNIKIELEGHELEEARAFLVYLTHVLCMNISFVCEQYCKCNWDFEQ